MSEIQNRFRKQSEFRTELINQLDSCYTLHPNWPFTGVIIEIILPIPHRI